MLRDSAAPIVSLYRPFLKNTAYSEFAYPFHSVPTNATIGWFENQELNVGEYMAANGSIVLVVSSRNVEAPGTGVVAFQRCFGSVQLYNRITGLWEPLGATLRSPFF